MTVVLSTTILAHLGEFSPFWQHIVFPLMLNSNHLWSRVNWQLCSLIKSIPSIPSNSILAIHGNALSQGIVMTAQQRIAFFFFTGSRDRCSGRGILSNTLGVRMVTLPLCQPERSPPLPGRSLWWVVRCRPCLVSLVWARWTLSGLRVLPHSGSRTRLCPVSLQLLCRVFQPMVTLIAVPLEVVQSVARITPAIARWRSLVSLSLTRSWRPSCAPVCQ